MRKYEETFDAVQTMRDIRDRLSERFKNMSFAEQKRCIQERLSVKSPSTQNTKSQEDCH